MTEDRRVACQGVPMKPIGVNSAVAVLVWLVLTAVCAAASGEFSDVPGELRGKPEGLSDSPSSFSPVHSPTALESPAYVLGVGDVVELSVWAEPDLSVRAQVSEDGTVIFPLIGPVKAAGLTPSELEEAVARKYADGYLVDPQINIAVVEQRSRSIYVVGAVNMPGIYPLKEDTTLLRLLAQCGGAAANASDIIQVIRYSPDNAKGESSQVAGNLPQGENESSQNELKETGRMQHIKVNRHALLAGDVEHDVVLKEGDIVLFTPSRESMEQVYVLGDVETRGAYALSEKMTVARLLASAGLDPNDEKSTVTLMRAMSGEKQTLTFSVKDIFQGKEAAELSLQDGDILTVAQKVEVYYVIGEVTRPGAFRFQKGLTVREAIIMAGWITPRGNIKNISVMRKEGSMWVAERAEPSDEVRSGDVIKVEERWF